MFWVLDYCENCERDAKSYVRYSVVHCSFCREAIGPDNEGSKVRNERAVWVAV